MGHAAVEVGPVREPGELPAIRGVLRQAFAASDGDVRAWIDRAGVDELRVARTVSDPTDIVGALIRIPMGQAFGGRFVPMHGIAGVSVRADKRRQGVASELMRATLMELWEGGAAMSTLYASNQPLYRRLGYEQGGAHYHGVLRPRDIDVVEREQGRVTMGAPADRPHIDALYREVAVHRPGHLDRGPYVWGRLSHPLDGAQVQVAMLWDEADELEAYVQYVQETREDGYLMRVTDAQSRTSRGWRRIWTHLRDVSTLVSEIRLSTSPTDPLYVLLPHPTMRMHLYEPWLVRVLDPVAALEARGYARGQPERLVIRVVDPLMGDQVLTLDVADGRACVLKGGDVDS